MLCITVCFSRSKHSVAIPPAFDSPLSAVGRVGAIDPLSIADAPLLSSRSDNSQVAIANDGRAVVVFTHQPDSFNSTTTISLPWYEYQQSLDVF
jgi:hypothetical protein